MAQPIKRNEKIHCRELNTGTHRTGLFQIDEKQIRTDLYSYDGNFHVNVEQPLYLQTDENHIVSLHHNLSVSYGEAVFAGPPEMRVRHQQILLYTAVVGRTQWSDKDQLKRAIFTVPQADHTLRHQERMERISRARLEDSAVDRSLFSLRVGANTYRVYYLATFSMDLDRPSKIWPCFEIEFDDGAKLSDYLDSLQHVVSFLALVLTKELKPEAIQILRLRQTEFEAAIENNEFVEAHSVEYIWPIKERDPSNIWTGHDFLRAWDDTFLAVFKSCLSAWIIRYELWKPANVLMIGCLRRWGEMSPERLLAACTWFEEIPTSKSLTTMNSDDVKRIALSANERAVEL